MTNQQLKAHCEDVIANPQDHLDWVVDMAKEALAALTQPASPVLKLPDLKAAEEVFRCLYSGRALSAAINAAKWYEEEAKRRNATHTAPIEPICDTGGADWVKVSERMPDDDTLCLGIDADGVIWTMHYDCGELVTDTYRVELPDITHWMPLPSAPEEK